MVDASHEKEAKAKETIQQLKMEIANLTRLVEQARACMQSMPARPFMHVWTLMLWHV